MAPKGKKPASKQSKAPAKKEAPKAEKPAPKKEAAPAKKQRDPTKPWIQGVYVKNLDFEGMSHETVKQCFAHCGNVHEVRLRHGKYVLVFFGTMESATKALEMNNKLMKGNKIHVKLAKAEPTWPREGRCKTVYVGGLPGCTTAKQLTEHFKTAGEVIRVRTYNKKHCAFVYFRHPKEAMAAMAIADKPFARGRDVSEMAKVPKTLSIKLDVKLSLRTKRSDRIRAEKRFNRRTPSQIEAGNKKSEARAAGKKATKDAKEAALAARIAEAAKNPKKASDKKKKSEKKRRQYNSDGRPCK